MPENPDDVAEIHQMIARGEIDGRESFGDDPEAWERLREQRQGVELPPKVYAVVNGVHALQDAPSDNK
jgi:hypothetical protein